MSQSKSTLSQTVYSVLPDNHSHLERALELSFSSALYSVDHLYPELLSAQNTPIAVVPYLAVEKQIAIWESDDSSQVKRDVTATAWKVRRLSGTQAGLKVALTAFGFESEINAWHQQIPPKTPYSLDIIAWEKGNKPVNVAHAKKLIAYIADTKSERDTVELSLVYGVETELGLAGALAPPVTVKESQSEASIWPMPDATVSLNVSGVIHPAINVQTVSMVAVIPTVHCYAELLTTSYAGYHGITVVPINVQAVIG